jgi:3-phosphoglycerate kinase
MQFNKKTLKDVPLDHQTVLVRADYNVPLNDDGTIADDYRLEMSLPTLKFLIAAGCKVVVMSHMGRPKGTPNKHDSLAPVAADLGRLLGKKVLFVPDCIGDRVSVAVKKAKPGDVIMLENLRFHPEEEANDMQFARRLAQDSGARYFVQDGFGVVHRAHASTDAITHCLPAVSGLLLEREVTTILGAMHAPKRPFVAVLGGAKVADKIKVIERFIEIADQLIIGGAMANTFLKYKGYQVGKSKIAEDEAPLIERIYSLAAQKVGEDKVDEFILLPIDVAVAPEVSPTQKRTIVNVDKVAEADYILDLGPQTAEAIIDRVKSAKSVIWNGTLGMAEYVVFAYASAKLAMALAENKQVFSLIGGGDTADFVIHWDSKKGKSFGHVSTGGGASLELMAGDILPGVAALMNK